MFLYGRWEGVSIDTVLTQIQLRGLGVDSAATVRHGVVGPDSDGRTQSVDEPVQTAVEQRGMQTTWGWGWGQCRQFSRTASVDNVVGRCERISRRT